MHKPLLSVIIPAYNCSNTIKQIVASIINQPFAKFEIIIVNDKSTDNTAKVIAELAEQDKRIVAVNQPVNGGAAVARNTGIRQARGRYIMFLDADDDIKPNTITSFIKAIEQPNTDIAVSGFTVQTIRQGRVISTVDVCTNQPPVQQPNENWRLYILRLLGLDGRLYQVWNKIYRADIIKQHELQFQPGINFGEDLLFNLDYFAQMRNHIRFINKALYVYQQDLDQGTFSKSSLVYANRLQNYHALQQFLSSEPDTEPKISLLHWIKYNWIYSHLLAIGLSKMKYSARVSAIQEISYQDNLPALSDAQYIGKRRRQLESIIRYLVQRPSLAARLIGSMNTLKNGRLTAPLWQIARRHLNH